MPPPTSSSFLALATTACKLAAVITTIGYAAVAAHRLRTHNAALKAEVDEARAERKRLQDEAAHERSHATSVSEFWCRMEGLARGALSRKESALEEKEAELAAQREYIHTLREARSGHTSTTLASPSAGAGSRDPHKDADSPCAVGQGALEADDGAVSLAGTDETVLLMVRTLNLEISEVASQVTNAFRVAETPDHDQVALAFDRAREAVGPVMAELLESIQHQDDPILIDIALKADMVAFAAEIASSWDFQYHNKSLFTGLYKDMRHSEPQDVSAKWRSQTRKYLKQRLYGGRDLTTEFAHQLAERIADLLTIAGGVATAEELYASYASHLETIVRTSLDLQRMAGEDIVVCDYEVLAVRIDDVFDAAQMEDIYNGEITAVGPPGMVPRVLSTADLGLRRTQKRFGGAGSEDGDIVTTMLLKPKVVLDTIVYELGLVEEEDGSPSTAGPSTVTNDAA